MNKDECVKDIYRLIYEARKLRFNDFAEDIFKNCQEEFRRI